MESVLFLALCLLFCPAPFSLLCAAALHELGHLAAAAALGWERPAIRTAPFGLRLHYPAHHPPAEAILVALSGSILGAAAAMLPFLPSAFRLCSIGFSAINLLPVQSLDGGGALLSALELFSLPDRAQRTARRVSLITVLLIWAAVIGAEMKLSANLPALLATVYLTAVSLFNKKS